MMNLNSKLLILLAVGIALIALLCVEAHPGKVTEKDEKTIKLADDAHELVSHKLDKRAAEDDNNEEKPPAKKNKKKKKSTATTSAPTDDKSTTTGSPSAKSTTTASPAAGKSADSSTTTTAKPDASTTKKAKGSSDDDDPDSSSMQTLIKNQRAEKKLLDKAYQALKDYVGFIETHDKFVLNPVGSSQMVSYVNALVPKYLTKSYKKSQMRFEDKRARFDEPDYSAPRHENRRIQFSRLGY